MSGYKVVRGVPFIYMTYLVVKWEKIWIEICNLLVVGDLSTQFFYVSGKQNWLFFVKVLSQG